MACRVAVAPVTGPTTITSITASTGKKAFMDTVEDGIVPRTFSSADRSIEITPF
jgi:hypothetical protein